MYDLIVADDREVYLLGMVEFLSADDEFRIVAQLTDWRMLLAALPANPRALVITSTSLVRDVKYLVAATRRAHSLVLLITEDSELAHHGQASGVAGVVVRSVSRAGLVQELCAIRRNAELVRPISRSQDEDTIDSDRIRNLTVTEIEMVELLMNGLKHKHIAERLDIPEVSVRRRFQRIFDKTGQSSRLELAMFVAKNRAIARVAEDSSVRANRGRNGGLPPRLQCGTVSRFR